MDIVKIGFVVRAEGLKDANKEVDTLLAKVDNIGTKGKRSASEFEAGQKKVRDSSKETANTFVSSADKMINRQEALTKYLPLMDKQTASLAASFSVASNEISKMDKFLGLVSKNKAIEQAKKDSELLAKTQQKQEQDYARALQQSEKARQSKLAAEQKYYQKVQEEATKANKTQEALVAKEQAQQELNRQKKFNAEQQHYQKTIDLAKKQSTQLKAEQQKITDNEEAARQKRFASEQKYYQKVMAEQNALQAKQLKQVGVNLSGSAVDKNSLPSLMALQKSADGARKANSGLLSSIKGIAAYALLSTAIYGVITGFTALTRSIVETSDEMQNLTQRLGIYLPANIKVNKVMEQLGDIAKENRVTLSDTGKLFTQLLPPLQRIKGGVSQTISVVDAFGKAMLIGGANTREAAAATVQFGQAMASGKLAGDEFRSLAEASPRLLQAIADGAGIAAQKLKEMSSAGKLTSGLVSSALLDQFIQLEFEAAKMGQTVGGALNEGMVAYQLFVDEFNKQSGFTDGLVSGIREIVTALEGFGAGFLANLKDSNSSLNAFINLFKTVWDLLGSVITGFTDVVSWITKGGDKIGLWKSAFDSVRMAIITIVDVLAKIPFAIVNIGTYIGDKILLPFQKFIELASKGLALAGFADASKKLGDGLTGYREKVTAIKSITGDIVTGFNLLSLGVKKTEDSTQSVTSIVDKLKAQNSNLIMQEKEKKAMTDQQYITEYSKFLLQKEGLEVTTDNVSAIKKELEERFKITQEQSKQLKIQGELQAKRDEAEKKAKEAAEKAKKDAEQNAERLKKNTEGYQDQYEFIGRVLAYQKQGLALDVAKIAAEKNYFELWKDDAMAQTIVQAQKDLAKAEALEDLRLETELLKNIQQLQDIGLSNDKARTLAQSGFKANAEGIAAAAQATHNNLVSQSYVLADQVKQQNALNQFVDKGLSLEEAAIEVAYARLALMQKVTGVVKNGLTEQQKKIKEDLLLRSKGLRTEEQNTALQANTNSITRKNLELQKLLNGSVSVYSLTLAKARMENMDANEDKIQDLITAQATNAALLKRTDTQLQLNTLAKGYTTEVVNLLNMYPNLSKQDSARVQQAEKLSKVLQKQQDILDKKKASPFGDFSSVDFEAFGDFGDPLQSALAGVNIYIGKMAELKGELETVRKAHTDAGIAAEAALLKGGDQSKEYKEAANNVTYLANLEQDYLKQKKVAQEDAFITGLKFTKSFFKEESKGYKAVTILEQALQAKKIAFAIWEKKDTLQTIALKIVGYAKDLGMFLASVATKIAAQLGFNTSAGIGAVLSAAQQPGPAAFVGFAAMAALVAGLGIAVASGGGSSGGFAPTNEGTGTVFGDPTAQSESIKKSIDLLADNSDLMLPINNSMLRSLQNIESALGGVANLIIRGDIGNSLANQFGFSDMFTGTIGKVQKLVGNVESFVDKISLGKMMGFNIRGVVSDLASSVIGGLFGKTSAEVTGSGLFVGSQSLGDILSGGINLQQYADVTTTKKSWFGKSTSYNTQFGAVDQEIKDQFGLIFNSVFDSILSASGSLGRDSNQVTQALKDSIINIGKIDVKGLTGEQIQEKLEAVISAQADTVAKNAVKGLEAFQKIGEGYFETLSRVASGIEQAGYFTERLGYTAIAYTDILNKQGDTAAEIVRQSVLLNESTKDIKGGFYDLVNQFDGTVEELYGFIVELRDLQDQLFMTGKDTKFLTTAMILGAGGLEGLSSGLDAYFEMLSPAEQAAELTRRLTNQFAIFGKELPSNVKAFRDLVAGIDITTEAGQKLYGQIIATAPEFNDLQDAIADANSEVNALVQSLRDLAEQARAARGETEQPRNLAFIRGQFESNAILAAQGDTAAAEKLLTLGKDLMSLSKQYSLSSSEYARDLALIQRAATVSADVQEAGLGYTTPTLTPLVGTTGGTVVQTANAATDAKLEALRADMVIAMTAVAKYTQRTSDKLDAWDFGDRLNVHVDQDVNDVPIPVTVIP